MTVYFSSLLLRAQRFGTQRKNYELRCSTVAYQGSYLEIVSLVWIFSTFLS